MKYSKDDPALTKAKFEYGNVLVGLALIQDDRQNGNAPNDPEKQTGEGNGDRPPIEARVFQTTRALGPFIVPMINYLGSLSGEDVSTGAATGDEE
jgi:hypothetical protein